MILLYPKEIEAWNRDSFLFLMCPPAQFLLLHSLPLHCCVRVKQKRFIAVNFLLCKSGRILLFVFRGALSNHECVDMLFALHETAERHTVMSCVHLPVCVRTSQRCEFRVCFRTMTWRSLVIAKQVHLWESVCSHSHTLLEQAQLFWHVFLFTEEDAQPHCTEVLTRLVAIVLQHLPTRHFTFMPYFLQQHNHSSQGDFISEHNGHHQLPIN